jgi:hypothetical protein
MYKHIYSFLTKHANMRYILQKEIQMYYYLKLVVGSEESKLWTLPGPLLWITTELIFSNESSDVIAFTTHYSRCLLLIF